MDAPDNTSSTSVSGHICPGCAHVDAITLESRTRPLEMGDLIGAWFFGLWGFLFAATGRTTRRLRCARCGCQFPLPTGFLNQAAWWLIIVLAGTGITMLAAGALGSGAGAPTGWLARASGAFQWLAARPLVGVAALMTPIMLGVLTAIIIHSNSALNRRHLYQALLKREANDPQSAAGEYE